MTIRNLKIVPPTLEIRKLLQLQGVSQKSIAAKHGITYFSLSNFLTKTLYETTYGGEKHIRKNPHIRKAIAETINVPYDDLWGSKGKDIVDRLIAAEVLKKKPVEHNSNRKRWSFKLFIKRLIRLGYVPSNAKAE